MSKRDSRFIADHRGGPLLREHHNMMAEWAAACAGHVLRLFESQCSSDARPRGAIATARAWARGKISVGDARAAASGAHAAARETSDKPATAAARSAGHAVATAHMADHCLTAFHYALRAVSADGGCVAEARKTLLALLPDPVVDVVESGLQRKYPDDYGDERR